MDEWLRNREIEKLDALLEYGEIDEYRYSDMLAEWEEGYEAAQEALWEMGSDR